jgi:hypothetical protein
VGAPAPATSGRAQRRGAAGDDVIVAVGAPRTRTTARRSSPWSLVRPRCARLWRPACGSGGGRRCRRSGSPRSPHRAGVRPCGRPTCWRRWPSGCPPTPSPSRRPRPAVPTYTAWCPPRPRWGS